MAWVLFRVLKQGSISHEQMSAGRSAVRSWEVEGQGGERPVG